MPVALLKDLRRSNGKKGKLNASTVSDIRAAIKGVEALLCARIREIPNRGDSLAAHLHVRIGYMKDLNSTLVEALKMYDTRNDLPQHRRSELNKLMNQQLASAVDLQMQMKQAHWNVKGPSFIGLHELFDRVARSVDPYVDLIAERIVQLGGIAEGTVRVSAARSLLDEYPLAIADGLAHVVAAASALAVFGREVRGAIKEAAKLDDAGTADLFTGISRGVDQSLWFIEAHSHAAK
jgi:starvation-inducible DNA-binding protein